MVDFVADGRQCSAPRGTTVLQACRDHGIEIPTLCHLDAVSPAGSCRVCLVEVAGLPRPVPACATLVLDGMEIVTSSEATLEHRRAVVEMLFAGGGHVCAVCSASGRCELQELARRLGLDHVAGRAARRAVPLDASHPRFALDPNRCVLCGRCVRVCDEVEHAGTLAIAGRGRESRVITDGDGRWAASPTCTACGRCVDACPTAALFEKAVAAQGARAVPPPARLARREGPPVSRSAGRARLATLQLGGCSGCHMSLLDGDEALVALAATTDLVYSPLADASAFPEHVDVCLVEGAVATEQDATLLRHARARTRSLVALGDCAGWGSVTAMRDSVGGAATVLASLGVAGSAEVVHPLLARVVPVGEIVRVDLHVPGCPPDAEVILHAASELLSGRTPHLGGSRFG